MRKKTATRAHPASIKPANAQRSAVVSASADSTLKGKTVAEEIIRVRAYQKWEAAGRPSGDGIQFWLEAEQELSQTK